MGTGRRGGGGKGAPVGSDPRHRLTAGAGSEGKLRREATGQHSPGSATKIKIPRARKALKGINSGERKYIIKKKNVSNGNVRIGSPSVQNVCPCSSSHLSPSISGHLPISVLVGSCSLPSVHYTASQLAPWSSPPGAFAITSSDFQDVHIARPSDLSSEVYGLLALRYRAPSGPL